MTPVVEFGLRLGAVMVFKPYEEETVVRPRFEEVFMERDDRVVPFIRQLTMSINGILSLSEWLYWEVLTFMISGLQDNVEISSQAVVYSLIPIFYMLPLGVAIGSGVVVGQKIGERREEEVRRCLKLTGGLGMACGIFMSCFCAVFKNSLIKTFTNQAEVIETLEGIWPGVCVFIFVDQNFAVNGGILRSLGMQSTMSKLILFVLYGFGVPLAYVVVVKMEKGIDGLWDIMFLPYIFLILLMAKKWVYVDLREVIDRLNSSDEDKGKGDDTFGLLTNKDFNDEDDDELDDDELEMTESGDVEMIEYNE